MVYLNVTWHEFVFIKDTSAIIAPYQQISKNSEAVGHYEIKINFKSQLNFMVTINWLTVSAIAWLANRWANSSTVADERNHVAGMQEGSMTD